MSDPKTTPVARMQAEGRNPGDGGETGAPDSAALHPGYGTMSEQSPEGWQEVSLGDVLVLMRNGTTSTQVNEVTEFPVTRIETISNGVIDWDRVGYLEKPEPAYQLEYGDILYSHINSIAHMGKVAVYHDCRPLYHGMNLMLLRPNKEYVDPNFIFLVLSSDHGRAYARRECKSAINQASLGQGEIKVLPISLPPLIEQRRIAEILDTLDNAIQKTEQLIAKLKQIKQGLLHDLLTRGIDENGQLRDPIAHPEQFKDSVLGRIPNSWDAGRLDALVYIHDGKRIPLKQSDRDNMKGVYPYYGASGIIDYISDYIFDGEYILLGEDGENVVSRNLPLAFRANGKFWVNNHAHVFEPKEGVDIRYIEELLEFTDYSQIVLGSAQPKITQDGLSRLWFPIPPNEEQSRIADILNSHATRINKEKNYLSKVAELKKGLMHDLITGKVRISTALSQI